MPPSNLNYSMCTRGTARQRELYFEIYCRVSVIAHGAAREVVIIVLLYISNTWAYGSYPGLHVSCSWANIMCDPDLIVPPSAGRVRAEYFTNETSYMGLQNALAVVLEQ